MLNARVSACFLAMVLWAGSPPAQGSSPSTGAADAYLWRITRAEWSSHDEKLYGEFVAQIGEGLEQRKCHTVDGCLNGRLQHAYRATNPPGLTYRADCADLPYLLRAYFAWKNALPFSYVEAVSAREGSRGDIRYSSKGNLVHSRTDVTTRHESEPIDARAVLQSIRDTIRSGHYRILQRETDARAPDFYPVEIARGAIRPGTVIYDPKGHIAVVYKITDDGRIYFIDAHPDNSLSHGAYGLKFTQESRPDSAPGFKNWRPMRLVGARPSRAGGLIGGAIVLAADSEISEYSMEQFFGNVGSVTEWKERKFRIDDRDLSFQDFVRQRLAGAGLRYDPIEETRSLLMDLCVDLHYRQLALDEAIDHGIHLQVQPERLPMNIYGTSGEWEVYSTPSRDARLKTSFLELRDRVALFLEMHRNGDPMLDYAGANLRGDLLAAYEEEAAACKSEYRKSDGTRVTLDLAEITNRLFRLSFDPYHCIERRWGAVDPMELSSCPDGETKAAWYAAEQRLRNQIERKYDERMDFNLAELRRGGPGTGVETPPAVDVLELLGADPAARPVTNVVGAR